LLDPGFEGPGPVERLDRERNESLKKIGKQEARGHGGEEIGLQKLPHLRFERTDAACRRIDGRVLDK
jgi:hypothetical protein